MREDGSPDLTPGVPTTAGDGETPPVSSKVLAEQAGSGVRWGVITAATIQVSTIASTVAAARLLTPSEFAIVGTAAVATGLFSLFSQGGFGVSVVTGERQDREAASTYFWGATFIGLALFALAAVTAPLTARLIGSPQSAPAIAVLSLIIPISLMTEVLQGVQLRHLRFGASSSSDIMTAVATGVLPIILLLAGLGPWAIILSRLAGAVVGLCALLYFGRWRPRWHFDRHLMRSQARFNTNYLGSGFMAYFNKNADYWVLGHVVSASLFGAYYVAYTIPVLVRQRATIMATQVATPLLRKVSDDPIRLRNAYEQIVRVVATLTIPSMVGLALTSDLVLWIAFGPQWSAAVTPMRIIAVAAAIDTISQCANSLFLALRRVNIVLRRAILRAVVFAIALTSVLIFRTLEAAAWSVLASVVVASIFTQVSVSALTGATYGRAIRQLAPIVISTVVMAAAVMGARSATEGWGVVAEMLLCTGVGAVAYVAVMSLVFRAHLREGVSSLKVIAGR